MIDDKPTIKCNYGPRPLVAYANLPLEEQQEFDYEIDDVHKPRFVLYKGSWYDVDDTMPSPSDFSKLGFGRYISTSVWTGILFKFFAIEGEYLQDEVIVGRYYS